MKISASTLIESIVALTIISIVFASSLVTFTSVTNSGSLDEKILVHQKIQSVVVETKSQKSYYDENFDLFEIHFSKTIEKVSNNGLLKLMIKAKANSGKRLEQYNEFIIADE